MKSILLLLLALMAPPGFVPTGLHAQAETATTTLFDALTENGSTASPLDGLEANEPVSALDVTGAALLAASSDEVLAVALEALYPPRNAAALRELLLYHAVPNTDGAFVTTVFEKPRSTEAFASGDIALANGAVYLINRVLLPPGFNLKALME
jgi:hypothetical protein